MHYEDKAQKPFPFTRCVLPLGLILGLLTLGLVGCHDAHRDNPFDPVLTPPVELISAVGEDTTGTAILQWTAYEGRQPFAAYWVLRKVKGLEAVDTLKVIEHVEHTTFRDTTLVPDKEYVYWVAVVNQGGFAQESNPIADVSYHLPSVELLQAELSSLTAAAELVWTRYRGPGFEAYKIHRQASGFVEQTVKEGTDIDSTTYTDGPLDGNTEYIYWISVRTRWGIQALSNRYSGMFYGLDEVRTTPAPIYYPHAVSLAVDEEDAVYIAMTVRPAGGTMVSAAYVMVLGQSGAPPSAVFSLDARPVSQSPIRLAVCHGRAAVSVLSDDGRSLVVAQDVSVVPPRHLWERWVDTGGTSPIGLHVEENGEVLMVDEKGLLYRFGAAGDVLEEAGRQLQVTASGIRPLRQVVVGPGAGLSGNDQFFLLTSGRQDHHVLGRTRTPGGSFAGQFVFDEGVGLQDGQTLNPAVLAFDRSGMRVVILDAQGRLQVFNAALKGGQVYVTKWGRLGMGKGEFWVSSPISVGMVVDSAGRVHVADVVGKDVRIQVFRP